MREPYQIRLDDLQGPEIAALLHEHLQSLAAITPPGSCHALDLDRLRKPEITFWSVWDGANLAGCGALKDLGGGHGEIKSMRTAREYLRRGVASQLLGRIISEAERRGFRKLSLETGASEKFQAAQQLYRKFGFTQCEPFADYRPDPNSRFFTRDLQPCG